MSTAAGSAEVAKQQDENARQASIESAIVSVQAEDASTKPTGEEDEARDVVSAIGNEERTTEAPQRANIQAEES